MTTPEVSFATGFIVVASQKKKLAFNDMIIIFKPNDHLKQDIFRVLGAEREG